MTFYFYDLETSGRSPQAQRIMQFAGQRTDEDLNPIGEPFVRFIKLSDDIIPEPEAILLTGITPQQTLAEGISEPEFLDEFEQEVLQPGTCIVGYNNIRFDDEFMRFTLWRNFYDAYEWQWKDERCRWDMLDVVRMTRALRPDGINWPTNDDGSPVNKLTEITAGNGLDHENAHDALSDVQATIDVARLIKEKQPDLFKYMYEHSSKKAVQELLNVDAPQPVLHTSGMLAPEFINTSAMLPLFADRKVATKIICWDLRHNPADFADLSVDELEKRLFTRQSELGDKVRLPVKAISTNKSPAIAPIAILNKAGADSRIALTVDQILAAREAFRQQKSFIAKLYDAWHQSPQPDYNDADSEASLYSGGFLTDQDKYASLQVRQKRGDLASFKPDFQDKRLSELYFRYRARNYPNTLSEEEHEQWEAFRRQKLLSPAGLQQFGTELQQLMATKTDAKSQSLITDLQLYGESIVPIAD